MDDHLVARWRRGEPRAAPLLRRHLGALVSHMWSRSSGGSGAMGAGVVEDTRLVRARVVAIVREAMAVEAASAEELRDRCVRGSARQRVTALLAAEGGVHPPVDLLVNHALRSGSARGPQEIEDHLPLCAECTEAMRCVSEIRRASLQWSPEEDTTDEQTDRPSRRRRSRSRRRKPTDPWPSPIAAWPVVVLVGVILWWAWNRDEGAASVVVDNRYAVLVDRTPPAPPPASTLPAGALDALRDLRKGDCFTAAARLRTTRRRVPDHQELRLLEGAAFVCMGDGEEALDAVSPLKGEVMGGEVPWTLARAHLLMGHPEPAEGYLREVIAVDTRLKARAQALLLRMAEVSSE